MFDLNNNLYWYYLLAKPHNMIDYLQSLIKSGQIQGYTVLTLAVLGNDSCSWVDVLFHNVIKYYIYINILFHNVIQSPAWYGTY